MPDHTQNPENLPVALSIATSDSGCGAGIQADLLTFAAQGVFGTNLFCCLTAQNPDGVTAIEELPLSFIEAQWKQLHAFFPIAAIKTGMLFSEPIIRKVIELLREKPDTPKVIDPVMVAASGAVLLQPEAVAAMKDLLREATLITPNLDEMKVLVGQRPQNPAEMAELGKRLAGDTGAWVLVKGGHLGRERIEDVLLSPSGDTLSLQSAFRREVDTHGSGCTLASAIAAWLARGKTMEESVRLGHRYLQKALAEPLRVAGRSFISHGVSGF